MAVIYISSTYEDLKEERKAAAQAVRRLDHRAIAMEDYVASDQRPVDKCLKDVRSCSAYVGIFAWRYGFIPGGYDKSITHLEYEAARGAGIPCLIFLLDQKADNPGNNIKKLRDQLQVEHTVSFFTNADQLGGLVSPAVSKLKLAPEDEDTSQKKSKLGPLVSKMCDRFPQTNRFRDFFQTKSKECPKRPHFYFIHGDELEGHESFMERLMKTCIKEFAEREWGEEYATIYREEVPWPKGKNTALRIEQLKNNLKASFKWYGETGFTAKELSGLPCFDKRPLVIIKHSIFSSRWDKHTLPLITWYMKEFWTTLDCHGDIPVFLVFFNVKYHISKEKGLKPFISRWTHHTKEDIREELEQICNSMDKKYPCLLFDELTAVEIEDVITWFNKHGIYEHELKRLQKSESIFKDKNNHVLEKKCMAEVEVKLSEIVKDYQREDTLE